jgi:hypothetical protein
VLCSLGDDCSNPNGNWAEIGCGKRMIGYYDPMGRSYSYLFDLSTDALLGGCVWSDNDRWGPCPHVSTYSWGNPSHCTGGPVSNMLACDDVLDCRANVQIDGGVPLSACLAPAAVDAGSVDLGGD